jgi:hypothetical protein
MEWLNVARLDLAAEPCSSSSEVIQRMGDKNHLAEKEKLEKMCFFELCN